MTSGAHQFTVPICPVCLRPKWQKHMEVCSGPPQRIAPPSTPDPGSECGCNASGMHERDCVHVTGEPA